MQAQLKAMSMGPSIRPPMGGYNQVCAHLRAFAKHAQGAGTANIPRVVCSLYSSCLRRRRRSSRVMWCIECAGTAQCGARRRPTIVCPVALTYPLLIRPQGMMQPNTGMGYGGGGGGGYPMNPMMQQGMGMGMGGVNMGMQPQQPYGGGPGMYGAAAPPMAPMGYGGSAMNNPPMMQPQQMGGYGYGGMGQQPRAVWFS